MDKLQREIMAIMEQAYIKNKSTVTFDDIFIPLFSTGRYHKIDIITAIHALEEAGYYLCDTPTGKIELGRPISLTDKGIDYILTH